MTHDDHAGGQAVGHGGSAKAIMAALGANLGIAVIKFIAFGITGAASMLAEAVHSVVDSGNQVLLLTGARSARRAANTEHPFGYGRERYVYGFLVALVLFTAGGLFAVYEGVNKIRHPHHLDAPVVAIAVLLAAIMLESLSLRTAIGESRALKAADSWFGFIRHAKNPELPVVLLEDVAALTGLCFALAAVGLSWGTGQPVWDGIGTCLIGALLITVAVVLVVETKSLLVGESAAPAVVAAIAAALAGDGPAGGAGSGVLRVIHLRTMHLGPEELLVGAKLAMAPGLELGQVARAIDAAEARVRAVVPAARVIYLEPDLDRELSPGGPGPDGPTPGEAAPGWPAPAGPASAP